MATTQNGNVNRATANTVTSAKRSAANRQCPECGRKSALVFFSDEFAFGTECKWCSYRHATIRPPAVEPEPKEDA